MKSERGLFGLVVAAMLATMSEANTAPDNSQTYLDQLPPIAKQGKVNYPQHSLRLEEEGDSQISFWIEPSGQVSRCKIVSSSGFFILDEAACAVFVSTTFQPAPSGARGPFLSKVKWRIPPGKPEGLIPIPDKTRGINRTLEGELPLGQRVNLALYLNVSSSGIVTGCKVRWGSENPDLNRRACDIASKWRYQPTGNGDGTNTKFQLENFYYADASANIPDN